MHGYQLIEGRWVLPQNPVPLLLLSITLNILFIVLNVSGFLPLGVLSFILISLLVLIAAYVWPMVVFLIFLSFLPLETILIAPMEWGIGIRPYQWVGAILLVILSAHFIRQKFSIMYFRPHIGDILLLGIPVGTWLSALYTEAPESIRMAIIVSSYYGLYVIGRIFLQQIHNYLLPAIFFLGGAGVSILFGILQNILFILGQESFSVMPGRPNGTFPEPDWFGLFLVVVLALLFTIFFAWRKLSLKENQGLIFGSDFLWLLSGSIVACIALILTVSRSAWLGGIILCVLFLLATLFFTYSKNRSRAWRETLFFGNFFIVILGIALMIVLDFGLTRFDLSNRALSTASGLQNITVACEKEIVLPSKIETIEELQRYGCQHILLEAISQEQSLGRFITTVERSDPNIAIRKDIFSLGWSLIRDHPIMGIGWGAIGTRLGTDERGADFNASNILLELWLGSGILGVSAFLGWVGVVAFLIFRSFLRAQVQFLSLFIFLSVGGVLVFDLFNAGILLGFLWILFSLIPILSSPAYVAHYRN